MAELEIHHEHGHDGDSFGKRVGVIVGLIGIVLAAVTIASHRAHTAAVIAATESNDAWAFYQSKKIRDSSLDIAITTLAALAPDSAKAQGAVEKFTKKREEYVEELPKLEKEARDYVVEAKHIEHQAKYFDLGEGLLELGMVLSSLYFLSKKRLFPYVGIGAALIGAIIGMVGAFI
jgi:Domain of unknown function (DUF4337)